MNRVWQLKKVMLHPAIKGLAEMYTKKFVPMNLDLQVKPVCQVEDAQRFGLAVLR